MSLKYLNAEEATEIDQLLMGKEGSFTLEQLMELAGLACATTVQTCYPNCKRILVCCGPGNQGGDGLVAARHLWQFGYEVSLFYPKEGKNEFYQKLKRQALNCGIRQISEESFSDSLKQSAVVLDAIFGFSFKGDVRDPFKSVIASLKQTQGKTPIVSVDIPSAWDISEGNIDNKSFTPDVLLSLTAPKLGARNFPNRHFLGGRFVPPDVAKRFDLNLPEYPGSSQIVEITNLNA